MIRDDLVENFARLFQGLDRVYGTYDATSVAPTNPGNKVEIRPSVRTVREVVTLDLWRAHLEGKSPLGIVPIRDDDTASWGCIDVDDYSTPPAELARLIDNRGLPLVVCRSKSGGAHALLFLARVAPAAEVRAALTVVARDLGLPPDTEIFPKQDTLSGGAGSWLNIPYFGGDLTERYGVKPNGAAMTLVEFLHGVRRLSRDEMGQLATRERNVERSTATVAQAGEALAGHCTRLSALTDRRKRTLHEAAFHMGRYVGAKLIDRDEVYAALERAALEAGMDSRVVRELLTRNLRDGIERGHPPAGQTGGTAAMTRRLSDVAPEPLRWLWPERLALGKVSMIAGHPGLGKSQLTVFVAAAVTTGGAWPRGGRAPVGDVVLLSAEDDLADTVRPRLDAAGGNPARVIALEAISTGEGQRRTFDLSRDIARLERVLDEANNPLLIIIDPITAYLGKTDSHRNSDVRGVLAPLQELASRRGVAVVCVSHLTKGGGNEALARVTGSGAFVAAARAAFLVVKDADDPDRRLFLPAKNNLGPDGEGRGLAYRVSVKDAGNGIRAPVVSWESGAVSITADEALAALSREAKPAKESAVDFLLALLADGPLRATEVEAEAKRQGISHRTLRRAVGALGIEPRRLGVKGAGRGRGAWEWALPADAPSLPI